jgi:hypothetical protein
MPQSSAHRTETRGHKMTTTWTKGPWTNAPERGESDDFVTGPHGEMIACCWKVARLDLEPLAGGHDEALANARLIAAAPELAEALALCADRLGARRMGLDVPPEPSDETILRQAHAALGRARGEC